MEMLDPEQSVGDQEVAHLIFPVVKDLGPPIRMLPFSGIRIFKSRRPVKIRQAMGISGEMRRNPVQDNADLVAVEIIDHPAKSSGVPYLDVGA